VLLKMHLLPSSADAGQKSGLCRKTAGNWKRENIKRPVRKPVRLEAITFGDLNNSKHKVSQLIKHPYAFRLLERLGTEPKVYYLSSRDWVRRLADNFLPGEYEPVVNRTWAEDEWSTKPGRDRF